MGKRRIIEGVGERLTEDLLIEVLLWLPMKPLLRFKSVSKSWFSLISSHRFAQFHLQRALASAAVQDQTLIAQVTRFEDLVLEGEDGFFILLDIDSLEFGANLKLPYSQDVYPFVKEFPFEPPCDLVGSECGIVCVSVDLTKWPAAENKTDIYLWNPATKQSQRIPPPTIQDYKKKTALGFCFDHINVDFKVVRVVTGQHQSSSAEVYSSNKNIWQKIEPKPIDVPYSNDFHACLHGFLLTTGYNGAMAFDINKEVFVCDIDLPAHSFDHDIYRFEARITDFNDSIAVFNSTNKGFNDKINLWTLDDEACLHGSGVKASWSLTISIYLGNVPQFVGGIFNNVEFLIVDEDGSQVLYNSDKKVYRDVPEPPYFDEALKYRESLFSVAGSKLVNWTASSSRLQVESD